MIASPALPQAHGASVGHAAPDEAGRQPSEAENDLGGALRWVEDPAGQRLGVLTLQFSGLYCAGCAAVIEGVVSPLAGVRGVQVNGSAKRGQVRWDPAQVEAGALLKRLQIALRSAGYDAAPDRPQAARELRRAERRQALWRTVVAGFCAMQVMMFATPSYVASGNELAPDLRQLLNWASWLVSLPVLLFSAGPFFRGAAQGLKRLQITMDLPVALGVAVTFLASTGATFTPSGPFGAEVYFDSLTMFVSFLLLGRYVEMSLRHRAAEALEQGADALPLTADRLRDGQVDGPSDIVDVHELRPGDWLRVPRGSGFPADGSLESEVAHVDEALLTGESQAVFKRRGDPVVGGSVNLGGPVVMRAERVGTDTRYQAILNLMQDAMSQRPAMARRADAWAAPFLLVVLLLAAGSAAVWSQIDPSRAVWVAVSVLIVTCPCALSLAVPSALVAAGSTMARHGVMWRRLDALEALAGMSQLFTDKTGTLTEERPGFAGMSFVQLRQEGENRPLPHAPTPGLSRNATLREDAAALARWSAHPLSLALVAASNQEGPPAVAWTAVSEHTGAGLEGYDAEGSAWRLGSVGWVQPGVVVDESARGDEASVWFGPLGEARVRFDFEERLRPDVPAAIAELQKLGVRVSILSGDRQARVSRLAAALGFGGAGLVARGDASPEDKLAAVASAQAEGRVVGMVGDGINDAPVLARADVSFAMGHGALIARTQADAVITSGRWSDLVGAQRLARRCLRTIRQNLCWAAAYNAACIPLAMLGLLPPWAAGLGMACSSLIVIGNSWRLSRTAP